MINGRSDPASAPADRLDHPPVLVAILDEAGELVVEGGVDHCVGQRRTARHAVRVFQRAAMHLGPGLLEPARAGIGAREPEHLMPGAEQFGHDPGADETGRAGQEHSHARSPMLWLPAYRPGIRLMLK